MPTWGAVGLGKDNAEVEPDEIQSLYDETLGLPPRAPYLCTVKQIKKTETGENSANPGTPMMRIILEIAEPPGTKKAKHNGYTFWVYRVISADWAGRVNEFLKALLGNTSLTEAKKKAVLEAFWDGKVVYDKDSELITKIGTWTLPEGMKIGVTTRREKYEGEERLTVGSLMSPKDAPKGVPDDGDEEPGEDVEDEEDPEVAERAEELEGMTLANLKTVAKGLEAKLADYRNLAKPDLIEFILDLEFPVDDEPEPEEVEEEEDEEEDDALDEMSRVELKKYIKGNKLGITVTTGMSDDDIREAIRTQEAEDDGDEEPEPEEEAPAPKRRQAAAKPAATGRPAARRRRGGSEEPPF